jgi:hypothetical protein
MDPCGPCANKRVACTYSAIGHLLEKRVPIGEEYPDEIALVLKTGSEAKNFSKRVSHKTIMQLGRVLSLSYHRHLRSRTMHIEAQFKSI